MHFHQQYCHTVFNYTAQTSLKYCPSNSQGLFKSQNTQSTTTKICTYIFLILQHVRLLRRSIVCHCTQITHNAVHRQATCFSLYSTKYNMRGDEWKKAALCSLSTPNALHKTTAVMQYAETERLHQYINTVHHYKKAAIEQEKPVQSKTGKLTKR